MMLGSCIEMILGLLNVCHPDNHEEVNSIVTPFHISPEWYFLIYYTILRVLPNKLLGLISFKSSIVLVCIVSEVKNVCSISRLISIFVNVNNVAYSSILIWYYYQVWLGYQILGDTYIV
jgi:quinol-cytochrome oxidoreductase complex cytochrome b subunit